MPKYRQDHIHLRSRDPEATARYYHDMFDGKIVESLQTDGRPRVDVDIDGLTICIAKAQPDHDNAPDRPYVGLDHFGLQVEDLEEAAADLRKRGAEFFSEPRLLRPGPRCRGSRSPSCAPRTTSGSRSWKERTTRRSGGPGRGRASDPLSLWERVGVRVP